MNNWGLKHFRNLSEGSNISDNTGQTPLSAKYERTFINYETGELRVITDLKSKMYKRDKNLNLFLKVYRKHYMQRKISILSAVVNQDEYASISKFVNTFTRKLKRKGIDRLGYVWVRDVGDEIFHKHYHIIIATTNISGNKFNDLFCNKKHNDYEVQFVRTLKGISDYLKEKDLFGAIKQRTYGKSRRFPVSKKDKKNRIATKTKHNIIKQNCRNK